MSDELIDTWNYMSTNWNKWAPPLRPSKEDILFIRNALTNWQADTAFRGTANVLLLGVTPEIASANLPLRTLITAVDRSQGMIDHVWKADKPNKKHAILGDWFNMPVAAKSQNVVLGDGVFVFFGPDDMDKLAASVAATMTVNGTFIVRQFIAKPEKEPLTRILRAIDSGKLTNFHTIKFRVAMSQQKSFAEGIAQKDVWQSVNRVITQLDTTRKLANVDKSTLDFYKDKGSKMYFPTLDEFKAILENHFKIVDIKTPTYDFGDCCPTFVLRLKSA